MLNSALGTAVTAGIESSAHLIQIALTPVFLLTAIAGFLNVFTGRLARIADRVNGMTRDRQEGRPGNYSAATFTSLRRRTLALQVAVVLGGASGAATCAATLTIFVSTLGAELTSLLLFVEFGLALLCLLVALGFFVAEMLIATRSMMAQVPAER